MSLPWDKGVSSQTPPEVVTLQCASGKRGRKQSVPRRPVGESVFTACCRQGEFIHLSVWVTEFFLSVSHSLLRLCGRLRIIYSTPPIKTLCLMNRAEDIGALCHFLSLPFSLHNDHFCCSVSWNLSSWPSWLQEAEPSTQKLSRAFSAKASICTPMIHNNPACK